ncbi:MAG: plastocyanin/azurin family copper-binding protein [Thermoproteota archaeon]|nr:plastocyanin/azurin family copper-binding protein [Thermoproteota archaeon]
MVLKAVIIVVSIVAIVLASVVIGGAIIVGQVLENDPNIRNEIRQWLETGGGGSEHDSQERLSLPITEEGKVVSIVGNSDSNSYNPNPIEIKVGDTVTWINNDSSPHTVTSSSSSNDSNFDSNVLRRGEAFSFTFDKEGEYPYFCTLHPSMVGTVVVLPSEGG